MPTSNPAILITDCSDSDINTPIMALIFDGMNGQNHFINAIRPHNMTPSGREKAREDYLRMKRLDPSSRWIKATTTASPSSSTNDEELLGMAQWNVYEEGASNRPPEKDLDGPPGKWDSNDDKEWAVALFRSNMARRRKVLRETSGPVICTLLTYLLTCM